MVIWYAVSMSSLPASTHEQCQCHGRPHLQAGRTNEVESNTVTLPLMLWEHQDASNIISFLRCLLLAEVPHQRMVVAMNLTKHIKEKRIHLHTERIGVTRLKVYATVQSCWTATTMSPSSQRPHIVVEGLVVQKQLGEQAQTLAVDLQAFGGQWRAFHPLYVLGSPF